MERSTGMDARSASRLARLAAPPPVDPAPAFSIPQFRRALLTWYRRTARRLPWRDTHDPYRVWVSEIMLQQTRVDTVVPYYEHFLAAFPTAQALAAAPLPRVLHLWQGLGYYRRARHLHRAALLLVRGHGGELPRTASAWSALPGVGRYTAAAIASIVHGEPVAAVDGNVKRVLARLCRITDDLDAPATQRRLWALADALLAPRAPGDFNQAMMELGARVCTPRTPACTACPVALHCRAHAAGEQSSLPIRRPRRIVPSVEAAAAVIMQYGRVLLVRRAETGLLGGLWTLPAAVVADGQSHADVLRAHVRGALGLDLRVGRRLALVRHDFTHRRLHVAVYAAKPDNDPPPCSASKADAQCGFGWVHPREFPRYPLATLDRKLLEAAALHRGPRHTPPPAPPPRRGALPSPGSRRPHRQITMNLKLIAPPR